MDVALSVIIIYRIGAPTFYLILVLSYQSYMQCSLFFFFMLLIFKTAVSWTVPIDIYSQIGAIPVSFFCVHRGSSVRYKSVMVTGHTSLQ